MIDKGGVKRRRERNKATAGCTMQLVKDFWRCGVVAADAASIVQRGSLENLPISWLPGTSGLRYLADPFGLWRDKRLYVFAEGFDYSVGIGHIVVTIFDRSLAVIGQHDVLRAPWHLSYPFVFEADGETWMLPEAHASGTLRLYRATAFPCGWMAAHEIRLDHVPLDATLLRHGDLWWLFYTAAEPVAGRLTTLRAAHAHRLDGSWTSIGQPILIDSDGARPGGTPIMIDGVPHLPLQRCTGSYGSGLRVLRLDRLTPDQVTGVVMRDIAAPTSAAPYHAGFHTLSGAGGVSLIDVKRTRFSPLALAAWPVRTLRSRQRHNQFD
jgi:hypothetical protein